MLLTYHTNLATPKHLRNIFRLHFINCYDSFYRSAGNILDKPTVLIIWVTGKPFICDIFKRIVGGRVKQQTFCNNLQLKSLCSQLSSLHSSENINSPKDWPFSFYISILRFRGIEFWKVQERFLLTVSHKL